MQVSLPLPRRTCSHGFMPGGVPPNPDLIELSKLLGADNVRLLVRTFLGEYPVLMRTMQTGDRSTRMRIAHSLKSNTRVVGARTLSLRFAELERRLADPALPDLEPSEYQALLQGLEEACGPLRQFAQR